MAPVARRAHAIAIVHLAVCLMFFRRPICSLVGCGRKPLVSLRPASDGRVWRGLQLACWSLTLATFIASDDRDRIDRWAAFKLGVI